MCHCLHANDDEEDTCVTVYMQMMMRRIHVSLFTCKCR